MLENRKSISAGHSPTNSQFRTENEFGGSYDYILFQVTVTYVHIQLISSLYF